MGRPCGGRQGELRMKMQNTRARNCSRSTACPCRRGRSARRPNRWRRRPGLGGTAVAQVLAGGRGKAGGGQGGWVRGRGGGVRPLDPGQGAYFEQAKSNLRIHRVLVEVLPIAKEYYIGITTDRTTQRNVFIVSSQGGMDIEEVAHTHPSAIRPVDRSWAFATSRSGRWPRTAASPPTRSGDSRRSSRPVHGVRGERTRRSPRSTPSW